MQRWQAPSSGWTPPAGWQQGTLGAGVAQYYTLWQAALPPPTIPAIVKTTTGRIDEPQLPVGTAFQAAGVPIAPEQMIPSAAGQIGPAPQISVAAGADATLADALNKLANHKLLSIDGEQTAQDLLSSLAQLKEEILEKVSEKSGW